MVTYPVVSSVNLPALVEGVIHGKDTFSKTIAWTESPLVQSTGGELVKLDDGFFYLVGGHVFMGTYRSFEAADEKNSPMASQTYLGEIRKLRFTTPEPGKLDVAMVESFKDPEFARRDLNAGLTIAADGKSLGAAAYGGVFTKDQLNFAHPILISAGLRSCGRRRLRAEDERIFMRDNAFLRSGDVRNVHDILRWNQPLALERCLSASSSRLL